MEHLAQEEVRPGGESETPGSDTLRAGVPGSGAPGADIPRPDKTTGVVAGFGILFFILLLSTMYTIAYNGGGNSAVAGLHNPPVTLVPDSYNAQVGPQTTTSAVPVVTPVIISSTPLPQPSAVQTYGPLSYVTFEAVPVTVSPPLQDLSSDLPVPSTADFFTIFSMTGQNAQQNLPYVSFSLSNPPLVIDYTVTPMNITDVKDVDYKIISTVYHEKLTTYREYEQDWFRVVVRDRDTGKVVLENGYGRTYSLTPKQQIVLYKGGNYRFEFAGEFVTVDLTMKVKKEGNIK